MNGITITGLDELISYLDGIEISEQLESKALKTGGEILKENVIKNTPDLTGAMKKSIKGGIKRVNGNKVYSVYSSQWDIVFADTGSSKNKKYVGFFERSIEEKIDEVAEVMKEIVSEVI